MGHLAVPWPARPRHTRGTPPRPAISQPPARAAGPVHSTPPHRCVAPQSPPTSDWCPDAERFQAKLSSHAECAAAATWPRTQGSRSPSPPTAQPLKLQRGQLQIITVDSAEPSPPWRTDHMLLALPAQLHAVWQHTPTWRAPHAKYVAVYPAPFWCALGFFWLYVRARNPPRQHGARGVAPATPRPHSQPVRPCRFPRRDRCPERLDPGSVDGHGTGSGRRRPPHRNASHKCRCRFGPL